MRHLRPLDALFPKIRQGILAAVLPYPKKAWYASELARRLAVTPSSLQRELRDLTLAGILKKHQQGRMAYYQANEESPIFSDLQGIMLKTAGFTDVLVDTLKPLAANIRVAFVYGSMALGKDQSDSDIDLMMVGTLKSSELSAPLRKATTLLYRAINPILYSPAEFRKKRMENDHFLNQVLKKQKLFVIGNKDDLEQTAD
jgi:DNA-binding transcriptional ArsR family regulator